MDEYECQAVSNAGLSGEIGVIQTLYKEYPTKWASPGQSPALLLKKREDMLFKRISLAFILALVLSIAVLPGCRSGTGNITITVADNAGNPLAGAKVTSEEQPRGQLKLTGITIENSSYVFFIGVKAGEYQIQINRFDYGIQNIKVTVNDGRTTKVSVKLEKN
jgi:hypothetical protein